MSSSQKNLYIAATVACMTGALFGYSVGFIGGVLVLPSFQHHFHLDEMLPSKAAAAQATAVTSWLFGTLFGVPLGIPICSRYGRRACLRFCAVLYVIGASLQMLNFHGKGNLEVFDIGRLINGFAVGAGTLVSPMYISEVSPASERGMLMSGYQTIIQLAALVGFWGAFASNQIFPETSDSQWQLPVGVQLVPGILLLLGTFLIVETPRYLAEKGREMSAEMSLRWLRRLPQGHPDLAMELSEIHGAVSTAQLMKQASQASGGGNFLKEIRKKDVAKRLHVGVGLMIAQNMVGLNALNYYAPVIFMSAGFASVSSSLFLTGLFGFVKLASAVSFMFVFVRVKGNRFWLKLGSAICGLSMFVLAYCVERMPLPEGDSKVDASVSALGIIAVLMVYVFAFFFGASLGPISWNVCSEIFPLHINAKCCAITTCTQWLFQIVIAGITPHLLASIGWATYLVYGTFCVLSFIWVAVFVPETRGVAVGKDMDRLFGASAYSRYLDDEAAIEEAVEEVPQVSEATSLLGQNRVRMMSEHRRTSLVSYT